MTTLFLASLVLATGGLISFLIWLLILCLVIWIVFLILGMLPLPAPVKQIVCLILALIFLLALLSHIGILAL